MPDNLIREMKNIFGDDRKRINHALAVLNYARQIQTIEGGNRLIVEAAAILHDIGIHEAKRKYNSSAGNYQEIEGPPIAREILLKSAISDTIIEHICKIIANHHSAKGIDTPEFRIIWDSDWLVNIPEEFADIDKDKLKYLISKIFKTNTGRKIAIEALLK